ncbi:lysine exporter LysO family protein [Anaerosalibacter massiliensis]|uniref:Lysine exporter LysO family protein n=1 Tax=Anaerosalibacter massiliensis TaxID=1347392 RepID=A0A9X2MIP1_9FIRM|nr:lysine exporter LysO family protein [Anaerosalibacter massiliensis]MCR2044750.1 lysine exporter LysO family protein [Anaerosalibacter massiliensis]
MIWFPFLCLTIGLIVGIQNLSDSTLKVVDLVVNIALIGLMITIGANVGTNNSIMSNLGTIGLNCVIISLFAIACSAFFTVLIEKTILPLEEISRKLSSEKINVNDEVNILQEEKKKISPLIWIMPISIIVGVIFGSTMLPNNLIFVLDYALTIFLMILYTSVGISLGSNRRIFNYIKVLGWKIIFLSIAIFTGSIMAGILSGIILKIPLHISVIASSGMSYYSVTGAYMTQMYGAEIGTYGFIVNVMREFFTVLFLPILIKISKGSPIAGGAAGNMDTMLVPVTKFVGPELGLIALITGTILTFIVPVILPILYNFFS